MSIDEYEIEFESEDDCKNFLLEDLKCNFIPEKKIYNI